MVSDLLYAGWVLAALLIVLAPRLAGLERWWVFPSVGAGVGAVIAATLGTLSHNGAASVFLLAFLVPVEAVIVGYCRNPKALGLTVAGLWLAFVVWVLRALPMASDTLRLAAFVLPVMFLFLLLTLVAYRKAATGPVSRGRATIELNGLLMFVAAAFAYPSRDVGLYLLIGAAVLCFVCMWGFLLSTRVPRAVEGAGLGEGGGSVVPSPAAPPPSSAPGRQYCPSCGSDNEGDSAYCRRCGRGLIRAPRSPATAA